jgi:hypothetical protein
MQKLTWPIKSFLSSLILCTYLFSNQAWSQSKCVDLFADESLSGKLRLNALAEVSEERFQKAVEDVRAQIGENHSYAVIDLTDLITEEIGQAWYQALPHAERLTIREKNSRFHDHQFKPVEVDANQLHGYKALSKWLSRVIETAFDRQLDLRAPVSELRISTPEGDGDSMPYWHVDEGKVAVTLAILGEGTEVLGPALSMGTLQYYRQRGDVWNETCTGCRIIPVKRGHALIFLARDAGLKSSLQPTIHRTSPSLKGERLLFVQRYLTPPQ